jgi:glycosyltransferase involved in cell wall biosynthesis
MLRILVSAYACEPEKGSEPGVGWNWVREIARVDEVWVITRTNNREPIERALALEPLPNAHWIYFDLPHWTRFWKHGGTGLRSYYLLWQLGVYFIARELHRRIDLDVIHHLTFGTYWLPSFLPLLSVPFVWGPVGGGESAPHNFKNSFHFRGQIYEGARDLVREVGNLNPMVRLSAKRAAMVLCKTEDTKRCLEAFGARQLLVCSEVGLSATEMYRLGTFPARNGDPFRLMSLGRLIHWKGFELALSAFARLQSHYPASEYWIVGEGPERKRLERLAQTLGVADRVRFVGNMPRMQVLEALRDCDVLVHPSLHDSGGWVCVEAMAAGRAVICLDLGGPATQVTHETGIKVRADSPNQVVLDLSIAMIQLARDRVRRKCLGDGGRRRVQDCFSWDNKREWIANLYSSHAPDCGNLRPSRSMKD